MTLLQEKIVRIVDDHSGGMKFTELLSCLTTEIYESGTDSNLNLDPDNVFNTIKKIPCLGILDYIMNLGAGISREKHFIYRRSNEQFEMEEKLQNRNWQTPEQKTEEHINRHVEIHKVLDELVADWLSADNTNLPSRKTVLELMKWSHAQTENLTSRDKEM